MTPPTPSSAAPSPTTSSPIDSNSNATAGIQPTTKSLDIPIVEATVDDNFQLAGHRFQSRLIVGTGRYETFEMMRDSIALSGAECLTVAVRRDRLYDRRGKNILDFIDLQRYTLLPNTAGCYNAKDAVRTARLGREILLSLDNPGADWVKLEVLGDSKTLLPDPLATLEATQQLVADGFRVLCYTNDDPITARRLKEAGAAAVMPAGSPIGSGQGILNPNNIRICLEYLKDQDPTYPLIVDAGVGTASDVAFAMELGVDAVLLNTAIAHARDPLGMARAMDHACKAGRLAYLSGRIPKRLYATASSPTEGLISSRPTGKTPPNAYDHRFPFALPSLARDSGSRVPTRRGNDTNARSKIELESQKVLRRPERLTCHPTQKSV